MLIAVIFQQAGGDEHTSSACQSHDRWNLWKRSWREATESSGRPLVVALYFFSAGGGRLGVKALLEFVCCL